ncbi:MAG: AAA family ATPase, partial [Pseudomonadota bacterium]
MTKRILIHSPKGGQGKTTVAANLAMMLADAGKRVLAIDADESESRGLALYFNVQANQGLFELVSGTPLDQLVGRIRDNLFFLPGGDLVQTNRLIDEERATPNAVVQERLKPFEAQFDYIIFDSSPNPKTRLMFNLFFYA